MAHWYLPDGTLMPPQPLKNGNGWRDPDLRDARRVAALPSVTTIISMLDKPGLNSWKYERITRTALESVSYLSYLEEWDDNWHNKVLTEAFSVADAAADFGTQVHAGISARLFGQEFFCSDIRVLQCVKGFWEWYSTSPAVFDRSEHTFVNEAWGYAGTLDALGSLGTPTIFDFKTQDAATLSDFNIYDPDYPLQLAGYALGADNIDHKRVSVLISRTTPGLVKLHEWGDAARYNAMWVCLLGVWQLKNKYYPGHKMSEVLKGWM